MSTSHDDRPELPDNPSPADVDEQLDWHDQELEEINADLARLREAQRLARRGDYEASNALLDEIGGGEGK